MPNADSLLEIALLLAVFVGIVGVALLAHALPSILRRPKPPSEWSKFRGHGPAPERHDNVVLLDSVRIVRAVKRADSD